MNAQLVMFKENGDRKDFPLVGPKTIIGRKEDCDIRIPLAEVSRQHAEFRLSEGEVSLQDLNSSNGTFVNNERIEQKTLAPGDRVVIGPVVFTLQIDGQPETIKPARTKLQRKAAAAAAAAAARPESAPEPSIDEAAASGSAVLDPSPAVEESFGDLGESDLALEALSESSSMTFDIDDLELGDSETDDK